MEGGNEKRSSEIAELSPKPRNRGGRSQECLGGVTAQSDNDLGLNRLDLTEEKLLALLYFIRFRISIPGGATFQYVCDVHLVTLQADGLDDTSQKLTRLAHKRNPLKILVSSRRLTHEHEISICSPNSKDDVGALATQLASLAIAQLSPDFLHGGACSAERLELLSGTYLEVGYAQAGKKLELPFDLIHVSAP